jgi:antitoxin PrlF
MSKKAADRSCAPDKAGKKAKKTSCRIESLISIDERGQMVLPKDLRDRASISAGDKLALVSWEKDGAVCCLTLIKAELLASGVRDFIGPLLKDMTK